MTAIDLWRFVVDHGQELADLTWEHARLVLTALALSVPVAVMVGVAVARRPALASAAVGTAGVIFTIPSLALFGLFVVPLGIGRHRPSPPCASTPCFPCCATPSSDCRRYLPRWWRPPGAWG